MFGGWLDSLWMCCKVFSGFWYGLYVPSDQSSVMSK